MISRSIHQPFCHISTSKRARIELRSLVIMLTDSIPFTPGCEYTDVCRRRGGSHCGAKAHTLALARRCRSIIWFNFAGTVVVLAVLIHVGSELSFILNSARLLPGRTFKV
jgi:hypothetical protein